MYFYIARFFFIFHPDGFGICILFYQLNFTVRYTINLHETDDSLKNTPISA